MARFIRVQVRGLAKTQAALDKVGKEAPKALGSAFFQIGEEIIGLAKEKFVPVDFGHLRASGFVELPKITRRGATVEIGFGGPAGVGNVGGDSNRISVGYAIIVHENPRAGRTGGVSPQGKPYKTFSTVGGWKFLEKPFNQAQRGLDRRAAELIQRFIPATR